MARAYAHFMLAYLWCKPYNPTTAATDLGLSYVTTPEKEVFRKYTRISLKDYYQAIEKDLTEGLPLLMIVNTSNLVFILLLRQRTLLLAVSIL